MEANWGGHAVGLMSQEEGCTGGLGGAAAPELLGRIVCLRAACCFALSTPRPTLALHAQPNPKPSPCTHGQTTLGAPAGRRTIPV